MSKLPSDYWNALLHVPETVYTSALVVLGSGTRYDHNGEESVRGVRFTNATSQHKVADRINDVKNHWDFNGYYRKRVVVVPRDVFNQLIRDINSNNTPTVNIDEYLKGLSPVSELKNKNVFIVWNKTTAALVRAVETEAEALTVAKEMATKNTNQAFLVLKPDSIAYQPVSITIDKVDLNG